MVDQAAPVPGSASAVGRNGGRRRVAPGNRRTDGPTADGGRAVVPFRLIDDPAKLRRVLESTLLLEANLELPALLGHVIEEARSIAGARYGALGVLDEDRLRFDQFLPVGLTTEEEQRIGLRPVGHGVLGLLITDPRPLRLADVRAHPGRVGFPPHHPPMTSFLGVPITVRGEVYGILYLTDKIGRSEFTEDDEALVGALAVSAGIAIENARLYRRVRELAVLEDRDRMARDLHDTIIQRVFAAGLALQSMAGAASADGLADRLNAVVSSLDDIIRSIRVTIYELGSAATDRGVRASLLRLIDELEAVVGFEIRVMFDGPVETAVTEPLLEHLLAITREGLTNVGRHAHATRAEVFLRVENDQCSLQIVDNGCGMVAGSSPGLGLVNLRRRAEKFNGHMVTDCPPTGGTSLLWQVPLE